MTTDDMPPAKDSADLQNVLTRYVDSCDGYVQAAEVIEGPHLKAAFLEIAGRRELIVKRISNLIQKQGAKADVDGSPEAAIHRWWIRVRAQMSTKELEATLAECVRGEKELERTVSDALENGALDSANASTLAEIATELRAAIHTFETALGR